MVVFFSLSVGLPLLPCIIFMDHHVMLLKLQLLAPGYNATIFNEPDHANIQRLR
jgi:hypothetical protein